MTLTPETLKLVREALEPFHKLKTEIEESAKIYCGPESDPENWSKACEWGDLRRAAAALAALNEEIPNG